MKSVFGWMSRKAPPPSEPTLPEPPLPPPGSDAWTLLRGEPEAPVPPSHEGLAPPPTAVPVPAPTRPPVAAPPIPTQPGPAPPLAPPPVLPAPGSAPEPVVTAAQPTPGRPCRTIMVWQPGNIGNSMFQYMFARMLQARVPNCEVTGYDLPMWKLSRKHVGRVPENAIKVRFGHVFDVARMAAELASAPDRFMDYGGMGMRMEYYGLPGFMRAMFPQTCAPDAPVFGPEYLVINVRANEILRASHVDYMPVPLGWYRRLIAECGLKPVFMGQIGRNDYSDKLRAAFPDATFIESQGAAADFETIRNATNIAVSASTFSWLAAWLSPNAQTIHLPLLGFLNPDQRADVDLIPRDDARYRFYRFPVRKWAASPEDLAYVTAVEPCGDPVAIAGSGGMAAPLPLATAAVREPVRPVPIEIRTNPTALASALRLAPLASPGRLRSAPAHDVTYAGPNRVDAFQDIAALEQLGSLPVPHRLRLHPPMQGRRPLPLFNEAAMPEWIVREHYLRPDCDPVDIVALPGHELGGVGLLQDHGRIFVQRGIMPHYINGLVKPDANALPEMWLGSLLDPAAEIIDVDVPVAVALHPNTVYGHFLLEMLPRLHLLARLRTMGLSFPIAVPTDCASYIRDFVALYYDKSEIIPYHSKRQRIRAPCFILPGMLHADYNFHAELNGMVADFVDRASGGGAGMPEQPTRLYLSRSRFETWHKIANEAEIEATLIDLGFTVVHPQTLSLQQQFALYATAEHIVSDYSSATHNALFAPRGAGVFCINWTNECQSRIGALRSQPLGFMAPSEGGFQARGAPRPASGKWHFRMDRAEVARQLTDFLRFHAEFHDRQASVTAA